MTIRLYAMRTVLCYQTGMELVDLTDQTIGNLTVASYAGPGRYGAAWNCVCRCGRTVVKQGNKLGEQLRQGGFPSCGCLSPQQVRARNENRKTMAVIGKTVNGRRCEAYVERINRGVKGAYHTYRFICDDCGVVRTLRLSVVKGGRCRCYRLQTPHQKAMALVRNRIRTRFRTVLKSKGLQKCGRTFKYFPYTKKQLVRHIESMFLPGMTWENRVLWDIDHIVPLKEAKTTAEVIALFALSNLQPMWATDNRRKHTKSMAEWQERHRTDTNLQA